MVCTASWVIIWYQAHLLREPGNSIEFLFTFNYGAFPKTNIVPQKMMDGRIRAAFLVSEAFGD